MQSNAMWLFCIVQDGVLLLHGVKMVLIARFMGPTWGPSGADRTQVGPMLAPWTLLSGGLSITFGLLQFLVGTWTYCYHVDQCKWLFMPAPTRQQRINSAIMEDYKQSMLKALAGDHEITERYQLIFEPRSRCSSLFPIIWELSYTH